MTHIHREFLKDKKHIHFIGIGGSGMFPLVQILHGMGYYITGSDNNPATPSTLSGRSLASRLPSASAPRTSRVQT